MIEWGINFIKWWTIVTIPVLLIMGIIIWSIIIKDRLDWCPRKIKVLCDKCGEVHELKVIRIFSDWYKGRYVVYCNKKHRFYIVYEENWRKLRC